MRMIMIMLLCVLLGCKSNNYEQEKPQYILIANGSDTIKIKVYSHYVMYVGSIQTTGANINDSTFSVSFDKTNNQ